MKVICTSDWQAAWYNLDQVRRAVNHILKLCKKHGVKTVIHCGDVKQQLNPVDIRVTNYMVSVIQRFKSEGIRLIFLLGNHGAPFDPATINGRASIREVAQASHVPESEILARFKVPAADAGKAMKEIKDTYGFSPEDVKTFVQERMGAQ
jgi:hypothetical protein